jgi:chemotaxis protein methyltransferase CheR
MTLATEEFAYLQRLVRERSHNVLEPAKLATTQMRLAPVLQNAGLTSIGELVQKLRHAPTGPLANAVVEALMVQETSFFRDPPVWAALRELILPPRIRAAGPRPFRVWCGATAHGQEPWSIAMLLKRYLYTGEQRFEIQATDISDRALSYARTGRYTSYEVSRGLSAELQQRFLRPDGAAWSIVQDIRPMVTFRLQNLCLDWPDFGRFDLILLRNVLYYFDTNERRNVLDRAARLLAPNGVLLLGGGEIPTHTPRGCQATRFATVPALLREST